MYRIDEIILQTLPSRPALRLVANISSHVIANVLGIPHWFLSNAFPRSISQSATTTAGDNTTPVTGNNTVICSMVNLNPISTARRTTNNRHTDHWGSASAHNVMLYDNLRWAWASVATWLIIRELQLIPTIYCCCY